MSPEHNKALIRRYYEDLWNTGNVDVAEELLAPGVLFRGSLGVTVRDLDGFKQYVRMVRAAFPDFLNVIEDLVAEGDTVVARLTYRGTHRGELFGIAPTGKVISYAGIAWFRMDGGKVVEGMVLGDTLGLLQQLGASFGVGPPEGSKPS